MSETNQVPVVLTIAGSDSSCGAGVQADIKTIAALGGYGLNALTSVVSETPGHVSMVQLLSAEFIADQIRVLTEGFPVVAVKTGMLGGTRQVEIVSELLRQMQPRLPLVVDPVMVATGGGRLLEESAVEAIQDKLLPLARLITPNMDEAEVLWGRPVTTRVEMEACAEDLAARYSTAVLVKGGHLFGDAAADVLRDEHGLQWYEAPRVDGVHTHGTGCTYSAAIATGLAHGRSLRDAILAAKTFLAAAIAGHLAWQHEGQVVHALNHLRQ